MGFKEQSFTPVSRRSFVRNAGLGVAALTAAPAWARVLGANDRTNVAVIGLGLRGTDLLNLLLEHRKNSPDIEVVALCDLYQKRLTNASKKVPGAKTYNHHQDVLQRPDIDAVFIATPDQWHAPITLAAMESGKDVYVEKPMTHTLEQATVVVRRAKELGRVVQVGVQGLSWRRWPKIREIIQSGMIGHVVAVQGTYSRNDTTGTGTGPLTRRRVRMPPVTITSNGNIGLARLPRFHSMPTGSSASANIGTIRVV